VKKEKINRYINRVFGKNRAVFEDEEERLRALPLFREFRDTYNIDYYCNISPAESFASMDDRIKEALKLGLGKFSVWHFLDKIGPPHYGTGDLFLTKDKKRILVYHIYKDFREGRTIDLIDSKELMLVHKEIKEWGEERGFEVKLFNESWFLSTVVSFMLTIKDESKFQNYLVEVRNETK
jgi:hypothetical protein